MRIPAALLALVAPLAVSCVALERSPGLVVASDPPGARVLVDGRESGFLTPCNLGLTREAHQIDLVLPGYKVARIQVYPQSRTYAMRWVDGYQDEQTWSFPGWLAYQDFIAPVKKELTWSPSRIFVPMRLALD